MQGQPNHEQDMITTNSAEQVKRELISFVKIFARFVSNLKIICYNAETELTVFHLCLTEKPPVVSELQIVIHLCICPAVSFDNFTPPHPLSQCFSTARISDLRASLSFNFFQ